MNKELTEYDKENIENWINFLIRKIEETNINKEEILTELKGLRKYFFKNKKLTNHE